MSMLTEAQAVLKKKRPQMTVGEWMLVGEVLNQGRSENPSNNEFGAWIRDNGFSGLSEPEVSAAQWLASKAGRAWFEKHGREVSARTLYAEYKEEKKAANRAKFGDKSHSEIVLEWLQRQKTPKSNDDVVDGTGLEKRQVERGVSTLRKGNLITTANRKHSSGFVPKKKEAEAEKEKRTLIGNAIAAATNRLESEVMKIIMPTADGLDRMTKAEVKEALAFLASIQAHGGNKKQPKNGVMEISKNRGDQRPGRDDYLFETVFTLSVEVR